MSEPDWDDLAKDQRLEEELDLDELVRRRPEMLLERQELEYDIAQLEEKLRYMKYELSDLNGKISQSYRTGGNKECNSKGIPLFLSQEKKK